MKSTPAIHARAVASYRARMSSPSAVRRWATRSVAALLALVLLGAIALVAWSRMGVMAAEAEPWQRVLEDPRLAVEQSGSSVLLQPADPDPAGTGLVFYPGAKVEPEAYAARLSALVAELDVSVVIVKPVLGLALLDRRDLGRFTESMPEIGTWLVAGHSLGGVRACQLADEVDAVVLFASYCSDDLSGTTIPVLSLAGGEDGLSTPEKLAENRAALPEGATMVEIDGASHASFGDYGPQRGDGAASISDEEMDAAVLDAVATFLDSQV